jgi:hypothetical protein
MYMLRRPELYKHLQAEVDKALENQEVCLLFPCVLNLAPR